MGSPKSGTWSKQPPGIVTFTMKLQELQLRLARLDLVKKLQRTHAVVQALTRGHHGQ